MLIVGCVGQSSMAKQAVIDTVHSDYPVEFRNLSQYPGKVVCGDYRAMGMWGGTGGYKPFIYRDDQVNTHPLSKDVEVFCTRDSIGRFYAMLGYEKAEDTQRLITQVRDDFRMLQLALDDYYKRNHGYPKTAEGLDALLRPAQYGAKAGPLANGAYLEALPIDPWNRSYVYRRAGLAGVKREAEVLSFGLDGAAGGSGLNADLKLHYLKYLNHFADL